MGGRRTVMNIPIINHLMCRIRTGHNYEVKRWRYTHGLNGNEPAHIAGIMICSYCGQVREFIVERRDEEAFIDHFWALEDC